MKLSVATCPQTMPNKTMLLKTKTKWPILLLLWIVYPLHADDSPFVFVNQNPVVSVHALARDFGADVTPAGQLHWYGSYSVASNFDISDPGVEQVYLDAESTRVDLRMVRGLRDKWEVGVEVPFVQHSGGYLDQLIIDWHDWFNLPQNGRDLTAKDRVNLAYTSSDGGFSITDDVSGISDIQLFTGYQLHRSANVKTALRGFLKLPSGDSDDLLGSGSVDAGVSLHHSRRLGKRWGIGGWIGASYLGRSDILPGKNRSLVAQGGLRSYYNVNYYLTLKLQWDMHSQVYQDINLRQFNEIAYLLSFGGTLRLNGEHALEFVVVENYPHPEISPDVAFQISWSYRPK